MSVVLRRLLPILLVFLAAGCSDSANAPDNAEGRAFLQTLAEAVEASDRIVAVEHSYLYDGGDANYEKLPEQVYATVVLTRSQQQSLASALQGTNPRFSEWVAACIFEPHHRLEFYRGGKRVHTLEVCFECGDLAWDGHQGQVPADIYATLEAFVRGIGLQPSRDWRALARALPPAKP